MTRPLKVWGGTMMVRRPPDPERPWSRQVRAVVATRTKKAAMEATDLKPSWFDWCVTGNEEEIKAAMARPGVVFISRKDNFPKAENYIPLTEHEEGTNVR